MKGAVCCMVLDCRRTGKPMKAGRPFICAKHIAVAGADVLKEHHHAHGANTRSRGQSGHWRFLEQSSWDRICAAVAENFELKPQASSLVSGN